MKAKCLLGCLCILLTTHVSAQSLSLSFQQESASFPFTRFAELHPGVELGYGFAATETNRGSRYLELNGGYFYHQKVSSAFYVKASYNWGFELTEQLQLDLRPSLGYLHSFYPGNVYENVNGDFVGKTQYGRPHALIEAAAGLTLFPHRSISPFVRYRFGVETPFANGVPAFPHSFYQVGLVYHLTR
jgi:hypothetical protein